MKALKMKKIFMCLAILAVALIASVLAVSAFEPVTAPAVAADKPKFVVSATPSEIIKSNPYQEFTVNVKVVGVSGVTGGMYGSSLWLIPDQASSLDFVEFVASKDVVQSATIKGSQHKEGIKVLMEGSNNGLSALTKDFTVGGFKFKLKQGVTPPASLTFKVEDKASPTFVTAEKLGLDSVSFTLNFREADSNNTLNALSISAGGKQILSGTGDNQTIAESIAYGDRGSVKISATRAGANSKIKVVDSVGNKTLVSERAQDLNNQTLGNLDPGEHTLTITVTSESGATKSYTVKLTVAETPPPQKTDVEKPAALTNTTSGFTGEAVDFTPAGMADLVKDGKVKLEKVDADGNRTPATIDDFKPTNAGSYKIVATPNDGFAWLGGGADPEYTFELKKATLTANDTHDGKLPTFTSDTYKGSLDNIVGYKYYSDEACTQEVKAEDLVPGESYFAKAFLKDGNEGNFEFDSDTVTKQCVEDGFAYVAPNEPVPVDPPGKENFLTKKYLGLPLWAWLIIALLVLMLIIILIIIIFAKKKKKEEDEKTTGSNIQGQPLAVAAGAVVDPSLAAKNEKLEDRMREMEHEASEREINRYKEEAEKTRRDANVGDAQGMPQAAMMAGIYAANAANAAKTERMEDRMRDMERQANERELSRFKDEIEKVKMDAAVNNAQTAAQPVMGGAMYADALTAKTERMEDRMREMERQATERELSRFKDEIDKVKMDAAANNAQTASQPMMGGAMYADHALTAKTERMEDRMREMERQATEREIARCKEEIDRLKRDADKNAMLMAQQPAATVQNDAASLRIAQLEAELRRREDEMRSAIRRQEDAQRMAEHRNAEERIAQMKADAEREAERIKEEARRSSGMMAQPAAAALASTEMITRLTQLEDSMRRREEEIRNEMRRQEDARRDADRKMAEDRIAQMKADAEREVEMLKQEARRTAKEMKQSPATVLASADMTNRFAQLENDLKRREEELRNQMRRQEDAQREAEHKKAEERIAQMKADAEREALRIKEEAERIKDEAKKAAEEIKRQSEATVENIKRQSEIAAARQPIVSAGGVVRAIGTEGDMDAETAAILRDYQERMRKMEQELQEQRMANLMRESTEKARKEMEDASKMRRHEDEMQRLRDLQEYERRQRQDMQTMQPYMQQPYGGQFAAVPMPDMYMRQQQELEAQRLKLLEERLKQREMEVQMLRSQGYGMPQQPYAPQQPYVAQPYPPQYPPYGQPQGYAPMQPNPTRPMGDNK